MQLPILEPALLVASHVEVFREAFENRRQIQRFENYLTGLMVLPNLLPYISLVKNPKGLFGNSKIHERKADL